MIGGATFEDILTAYQDKVFRLCCAMLGDRARAEEVCQEVFMRIWKALPGYRGEASVSTWIYAITRNACLTALKSRPATLGLSLEDPTIRYQAERASAASNAPDRRPDVLALVRDLPIQYQQVVLLFYMQERSYEEVAAMLDLPLGTVKTFLHRARKQLAQAVSAAYPFTMAEKGRSE